MEGIREETKKTDTYCTIMTELISVLKKVSREIDFYDTNIFGEKKRFEQAFYDGKTFYATAFRFNTGIYSDSSYKEYFEVVLVQTDILDKERYLEILHEIYTWKPFRYVSGYHGYFGRLVFIIADKIKGFFKPALIFRKIYYQYPFYSKTPSTLFVVLKNGKERSVAVALVYLVNYFVRRSEKFLAKLTDESEGRFRVWKAVKDVFNGRLFRLTSALHSLYSYINYRVEALRERRRISEPVEQTGKLLAEFFYTFAKAFDKYGTKIYLKVVSKFVYKIIKDVSGFRMVPLICKEVLKRYYEANEFIVDRFLKSV